MLNNDKTDKIIVKQFWVLVIFLILPVATVYAQVDFANMIGSLKNIAGPIIRLVGAISYVMGLWFIYLAIQSLKKAGQSQMTMQQTNSLAGPLIKFVVGLLLLYLPTTIDVTVVSLSLGSEAESLLSYTPSAGDPFGPVKEGAIAIVRVIGYVSFVRGLVILSHSGEQGSGQQGSFGKGILHLIGGILAINILATIGIISSTLGFSVM